MVRVGGGWMALDEFLLKNDPCRGEFKIPKNIPQFPHPNFLFVNVFIIFLLKFFMFLNVV